MLNWLLRVLGLGPTETPSDTTPVRPFAPPAPASPVEPRIVEPRIVEPHISDPHISDREPPSDAAMSIPTAPAPLPPEPVVHTLQVAAFTIMSSAGSRVFARPVDCRLAHEPGNPAPEGWDVHGFVTDQHPGILFVLAAEGPTSLSHGHAVAHAFRIEESGEDAFALFDLASEAYLCAPQFEPGVNGLDNDRGVVNGWEMFHLVAAENVALPPALPPLLPPAGTPITASDLQGWRRSGDAG